MKRDAGPQKASHPQQMPQTPFLDALGIKAPMLDIDAIREEVRRNKAQFS